MSLKSIVMVDEGVPRVTGLCRWQCLGPCHTCDVFSVGGLIVAVGPAAVGALAVPVAVAPPVVGAMTGAVVIGALSVHVIATDSPSTTTGPSASCMSHWTPDDGARLEATAISSASEMPSTSTAARWYRPSSASLTVCAVQLA